MVGCVSVVVIYTVTMGTDINGGKLTLFGNIGNGNRAGNAKEGEPEE